MEKKKVFVFLMLLAVLITVGCLVITMGESNGSGSDSSGMPIGTFFVLFILPGIVLQQKKRREQKKMQQQYEEGL